MIEFPALLAEFEILASFQSRKQMGLERSFIVERLHGQKLKFILLVSE